MTRLVPPASGAVVAVVCVLLVAGLLRLTGERALRTEAMTRDTLRIVRADRRSLEHAFDSVRAEAERLAAELGQREAEYSMRIEAALSEAQDAGSRADSLEAELKSSGLDTAAARLLDKMTIEHEARVERLEETLALQDQRYGALRAYARTLEGQAAAGRSLEENLREANRLLAKQVRTLNRQLHPPLRLRLAEDAKIALPALAAGIIAGALLAN